MDTNEHEGSAFGNGLGAAAAVCRVLDGRRWFGKHRNFLTADFRRRGCVGKPESLSSFPDLPDQAPRLLYLLSNPHRGVSRSYPSRLFFRPMAAASSAS